MFQRLAFIVSTSLLLTAAILMVQQSLAAAPQPQELAGAAPATYVGPAGPAYAQR